MRATLQGAQTVIIIEGPDLVGKTTLARDLQETLAVLGHAHTYCHFSKLPIGFDRYWHYLPWIQPDVVMDRFYISRQAYARACHNQLELTPFEIELLDGKCAQACAYIVVCVASDDFIREQYATVEGRNEMYTVDRVVQSNREYKQIIDSREMRFHDVIDVSTGQWPSFFVDDILKEYLNRRAEYDQLARRKPSALLS